MPFILKIIKVNSENVILYSCLVIVNVTYWVYQLLFVF